MCVNKTQYKRTQRILRENPYLKKTMGIRRSFTIILSLQELREDVCHSQHAALDRKVSILHGVEGLLILLIYVYGGGLYGRDLHKCTNFTCQFVVMIAITGTSLLGLHAENLSLSIIACGEVLHVMNMKNNEVA